MKTTKTLLEKIMERRAKGAPSDILNQEAIEEGQVLVAWLKGQIETSEACAALEFKTPSQIHQRAGTALRNLLRGRYVRLEWNDIEVDDEGTKDVKARESAE